LPIISKSAVWRSERVRDNSAIVSLISPVRGRGKGIGAAVGAAS
jgi:hypothetical protein